MKEFDFDELDKAVNSLMAKAPQMSTQQPKTDEAVLHLPDTNPANSTSQSTLSPQQQDLQETSVVSALPRPTTVPETVSASSQASQTEMPPQDPSNQITAPVLPKRSGRFMDVVHPSSDMRTPARARSRVGVSITPPAPQQAQTATEPTFPESVDPVVEMVPTLPPEIQMENTSEVEQQPEDSWSNPIKQQAEPESISEQPIRTTETSQSQPAVAATSSSLSNDLDLLLKGHEPSAEPTVSNDQPTADGMTQPPVIAEETTERVETNEEVEPSTSPFIAGTKVDKRPLGSPTSSAPVVAADQLAAPLGNTPVVPATDTPTEAVLDAPLPIVNQHVAAQPELDTKLLAIESGELTNTEIGEVSDKPEVSVSEADKKAAVLESPAQPIGASSIAPQYKAQQSTGDHHHQPIYDDHGHVSAIKHPPKKKSSLVVIIGIILLILVGVGALLALYYFNYL